MSFQDEDDDTRKDQQRIAWHEVAAALVRRWKLIGCLFVLGAVGSTVFAFMPSPVYQSAAKLMVSSERTRITVSPDPKSGPTVEHVTDQDLNSEAALLRSRQLIRDVLEQHRESLGTYTPPGLLRRVVNLLTHPADLPSKAYGKLHDIPHLPPFEDWVKDTAEFVVVTPIKGSNLIEVSFQSDNPEWTSTFINQLVQRHVERHAQLHQQSEARRFIESQRELLSEKLRTAETARQEFYAREGLDAAPEQRTTIGARLAELEASLASSETELAEASARAQYLASEINGLPKDLPIQSGATSMASPAQMVRSRVLDLELQRSQLLAQYAPTSIKVRDIDRQIADARRIMEEQEKRAGSSVNPAFQTLATELSQTRVQTAAVKARIEAIRTQIAENRTKTEHLDRISAEQERIEQAVTAAREGFVTYLKKEEEARFSTALDESRILNVSIVENAQTPMTPMPSKTTVKFMLGLFMSLVAAAGIGYLRDRFDPSVKSAAEAQRLSGLPILADIPS